MDYCVCGCVCFQRIPAEDGFILESARALHRDIPNVLESARNCHAIELYARESGMQGGCVNILLDDIMQDYAAGFDTWVHVLISICLS